MAYTLDEETPKPPGIGFQAPADQPGVVHINNTAPTDYPTGPTPTMDVGGRQTDRFINFSRIFNANAGAARNAATQLANRTTRQGQAAREAFDKAQGDFNTGVDKGTVKFEDGTFIPPEVRDGGAGSIALGPTDDSTGPRHSNGRIDLSTRKGEGLLSDDSHSISREEAVTRSNSKYTGPMGMGSDALQAQEMDAAGQARGVDDFNQRQAVLGNSKLNSALVGAAGGKSFANIARAFGGLDTTYNNTVADDAARAQDAVTLSDSAAKQYGDLVTAYDADEAARKQSAIDHDPHTKITADSVGTSDQGWKDIDSSMDSVSPLFSAFGASYIPGLVKLGAKGWKQLGDKPMKRQYEKDHGLAPGSLGNND